MRILVDSNILLRYVDADDPVHEPVRSAVDKLLAGGHTIGYTPQVTREVWNVLTRPKSSNGVGMGPEDAERALTIFESIFEFWDDVPGIAAEWRRLAVSLSIRGVQVHDANHAAAAITHGANYVLTLNQRDFGRFRSFGLNPMLPETLQ